MTVATKRRAVFLDRDGVLTVPEFRDGRSFAPRSLADFALYDAAPAAVGALKNAGFLTIAVTNQPDVGAGLMDAETLAAMHTQLSAQTGIDDILVCTHTRADACTCRKPKPGMLLDAAARHDIDLSASFMIGDRASDIEAGRAAGCATVFLDLGYTAEAKPQLADWSCTGIKAATDWILEQKHTQSLVLQGQTGA